MKVKQTLLKKPLLSILMATHNDSGYINQSIESVRAQTFTDWEFIIVNDASTDNTEKLISQYLSNDNRFRYIKNSKNLGVTKSLNKGLAVAKGKFIAKLDGDDYWSDRSKLEQQVNFMMKNPDYGIVGCFAFAVDQTGKKLYEIQYPHEDTAIRKIILMHNCFLHSSVVLRKSLLNKIGTYTNRYKFAIDYDLFLRIGKISKFCNIPKFMLHYRINPNGVTQTKYWDQVGQTIGIIADHKESYPNYLAGYVLWNVRKFYPLWFRGAFVRKIKKISLLYRLVFT